MQKYEFIGFAATHKPSVMGSMNDLAFHDKWHIQDESGVHSAMLPQIIYKLNRMPMGALNYPYSIAALQNLYGLQMQH
jgi:uncharacterized protein DUF6933